MHIESIPIGKINPAAYNPRVDLKPGDRQYDQLQRSMDEFGFVEPLVWNQRTGNLVGGHQRLKILRARKVKQVEVSVVDLPLEREQALNVALNKIGGDWDEQKLADLLTGLADIPDFDVSLTGFDATEISSLLDRLEGSEEEDDFDLADALDAGKGQPPVTQVGELIELGNHRLLCGDSAKIEDVERLLAGSKADLVFTDPPYNVDYYGGSRPTPKKARPKRSREWERIYMDDLSQEDYEQWLGQVMQNMHTALAPGGAFYIWNGHRQFGPMHALLTESGAHISCVIVWAKESFAIGYGDYNQQTEFCLYGWQAPSAKTKKSPHRWYGPTNESTLWQIHRDRTRDYRHPTQKPLALAERALKNSSRRDEVVLDLFLGSGSSWFNKEILKAGTKETRVLMVGTIQHYDSLLARLTDPVKSPFWESKVYRSVIKWSARPELWQTWSAILHRREEWRGSSGLEAARRYFEAHAKSMLKGTEVLWPDNEDYYTLMRMRESERIRLCWDQLGRKSNAQPTGGRPRGLPI